MQMKKIVILHSDIAPNASEDELDCLKQADTIAQAVRQLGYEPFLVPFCLDLGQTIKTLHSLSPEVVFNLVESLVAKGSLIHFAPALLDYLKIPYTGARTESIFLTSCKPLAKKMLHAACIPTPAWITEDGISTGSAHADKYIIKSSWEHASIGLDDDSIISTTDKKALLKEMNSGKKKLGGSCYAEAYIDGREFNVALIAGKSGVRILPVAEIIFVGYTPEKPKIVNYKAKWISNSFEYNSTISKFDFHENDDNLISVLSEIALHCWNLFSLRGYARVDLRVDNNGNPWVLEINANPCLSLDAGFAAAFEKASIKYHEAIELIINDALN
jgi:D-alanine-D-alanine ligase